MWVLTVGLLTSQASGVDAKVDVKVKNSQTTKVLNTGMSVTQKDNYLVFSMPDGPDFVQIYSESTLIWEGDVSDGGSIPINSTEWPTGSYTGDPRHGGYIVMFQVTWEQQ